MTNKKFSVTRYHGIGEAPRVILLNKKFGSFKFQFDTIAELENYLGPDVEIYFVVDQLDNRINGLDNWNLDTKFDYAKLNNYINNLT